MRPVTRRAMSFSTSASVSSFSFTGSPSRPFNSGSSSSRSCTAASPISFSTSMLSSERADLREAVVLALRLAIFFARIAAGRLVAGTSGASCS